MRKYNYYLILFIKMHFEQDPDVLRHQQQQQNWLERYLSKCSISSTNDELYVTLRPVRLSLEIDRPEEYNPIASINKNFKCIPTSTTYPLGEFEYHILVEPIIIELKNLALSDQAKNKEITTCYVSQFEPRFTIWYMNRSQLVDINSIMYDMAMEKKLKGKVEYLSPYVDCHNFMIESWSKFYTKSGRPATYKSKSICQSYLEHMEANVKMNISGLVQNLRTGIIKGLVYVEEFRIVNPIHTQWRDAKTTMKKNKKNEGEEDKGEEAIASSSSTTTAAISQ